MADNLPDLFTPPESPLPAHCQDKGDPAEIVVNPRTRKSDLRMLRKAARYNWRVPERAADIVPERVLRVVETSKKETEIVRAAQVLVSMVRNNVQNLADLVAAETPAKEPPPPVLINIVGGPSLVQVQQQRKDPEP